MPRLLVLVAIMVAGWVVAWQFARKVQPAAKPPLVVEGNPKPVVPDRSIEFESVTDWDPMALRDNAAFARLLERARSKTPGELANESRQDVMLTQVLERPALYRGVPIHLEGTARRCFRYESKLSKTGWLYEIWVDLPDVIGVVFDCVFEEPPKGFPLGMNIAEPVVFNGYFLKIVLYHSATADQKAAPRFIKRGSPVLVGRLVWNASNAAPAEPGSGSTLRWTLILLGVLIAISAVRWAFQLRRFFGRGDRGRATAFAPDDQIDPETLRRWAEAEGAAEDDALAGPDIDGKAVETAGSGARPSDEAQSTSSPEPGD